MGYQAVNAVMTRWTHLNDQPFRALTFMAHMAHDGHEPPTYFAGHRALALALGMDPSNPRTFEKVRRVLRTVEDAGALVAGMEGKAGQRRDYALALDPDTTYRSTGVHPVTFARPGAGAADGETYVVNLTSWQAVPREDPRPRLDPPHEMGGDPPRDMGGTPPRDMGGDPPHEMGPTPHATWDPTRTTNKHSNGKPRETETGTPIPSQPNPSTRAHANASNDDDRTPSRAEQEAGLLRLMAEWTPDAEEVTP